MQGLVPPTHSSQHPPPRGSAPRRGHPALAQPSQALTALRSALWEPTETVFIPHLNPAPDTKVPSPWYEQPLSPLSERWWG